MDLRERAAAIRLAVFDVDGVMTDGRLFYGAEGEALKVFHVRDGHGLKQLARRGITVAVISGRGGAAVKARLADLGIGRAHLEVDDKAPVFEALIAELGLTPAQAAFMGDDLPDLPAMQRAGLALTVPDAAPEVRAAAHWTSARAGGAGAVREACDLLLDARAVDADDDGEPDPDS